MYYPIVRVVYYRKQPRVPQQASQQSKETGEDEERAEDEHVDPVARLHHQHETRPAADLLWCH